LKRILLGIALFVPLLVNADDLNWFASDQKGYSLDFSLGRYEDGAELYGVAARIPLFLDAEVYGRYSTLDSDYQSDSGSSLYLQTDPYAKFTLGLGYEAGNRNDGYQVEDWVLLVATNFDSWYLEANLLQGDVVTTPEGFNKEFIDRLRERGWLDATRQGLGASATYFASQWSVKVSFRDYDIERDKQPDQEGAIELLHALGIADIDTLRAALSTRRGRAQLRRLSWGMYSSNQQYYRQVSHIADSEASVDVSFAIANYNIASGAYWYESAYLDEQVSSVYSSVDYPISSAVSLGLLISASDQASSFYSELGFGLHW